ncbi:MAG: heme ABC transporter permease [Coxiella sp. RIFCSPHIGHO2_12_FULL_44_14]|nr:MAG: heme ABC transporter permease [Coxiella sp. RIFCSPHIGHO2_12_FULL_44_14]
MTIKMYLSAKHCYRLCCLLQPWVLFLGIMAGIIGLLDGLVWAPADYQQGEVYRILFIHVPAAVLSLGVYCIMALAAVIYLIWKIRVVDVIAKVSAPVGALFTLLTLITGSLWGKPTWGTYWIWDARLTSELILFFIYCGIMAIRSAFTEPFLAAQASGVMTLVGLVNIPIVHYSVVWWNTLHQSASILKWGKPSMVPSMLSPLLWMLLAYSFYYLAILLVNVRYELLKQAKNTTWVHTLFNKN